MSVFSRFCFWFGLAGFGVLTASFLCAREEPASDLTPVLPHMRKLFANTNGENDSPEPARVYSGNNGSSASVSADGKWLLLADGINNGVMMLCDLSDRQQGQPHLFRIGSPNLESAPSAISPDGKTAALILPQHSDNDLSVHFFDTATGKQIREIDNDQPIFSLTFSPDGRLLAVGTQQRIELWKAEDGEEFRLFPTAQNANYRLLTFSPDGRMIAALGTESDTVHIWEVASGKERASVHHFSAQPMPFNGGRGALRGMPFGMVMRGMFADDSVNSEGILALAFSADGRMLAVSKQDSGIHLWDLQTNRELAPLTGFRGQVSAMAFSADGKELIAVDTESTRLSWRMAALHRNSDVRLAPLDDADFAELWNDLAGPDAFRVYRARRHLAADPKRTLALLSRHLEPVPPGDAARIQQLVKDLSSANAGKRRKAMTELRTKHGEAALGALLQKNGGGNAAVGGMPGLVQAIAGGMAMGPGGDNNPAALLLLQKLQTRYNTPERQRDLVAVHVLGEIGTPQAKQLLMKLSKGAAGVRLTTEAKAALDSLGSAAKQSGQSTAPEQLWSELRSDDAARAYRAMRHLLAMPKQAVSVLGERLKPVPVVEEKELIQHLANLESDDFRTREQASSALEKSGEQAVPILKKALEAKPALESRKRLEQLLERLTQQTPTAVLQSLRAIEVLEHVGTVEAKEVLKSVSGGAPQAQLTREAKASLQRLARR